MGNWLYKKSSIYFLLISSYINNLGAQKLRFITIRKLAFSNTILYYLIYLFNRIWIKWLRTLRTLTTLNKKSLSKQFNEFFLLEICNFQ